VLRRAGGLVRPKRKRESIAVQEGKLEAFRRPRNEQSKSSTTATMVAAAGPRVLTRGRTAPTFYNREGGGGVGFLAHQGE
jgi:hypothetical protein